MEFRGRDANWLALLFSGGALVMLAGTLLCAVRLLVIFVAGVT